MRSTCVAAIFFAFVSLCACNEPDPTSPVADAPSASSTPTDVLTGTWTGDWGPSEDRRNLVTMALDWDGTHVTGALNPGVNALAITRGSFAADTGVLTLEADGNGADGKNVHYTMEGQLTDGMITGTWMDGDKKNDFKLKKG